MHIHWNYMPCYFLLFCRWLGYFTIGTWIAKVINLVAEKVAKRRAKTWS